MKIEDQEFLENVVENEDEQFSNYLEIAKRNKSIDKDRFSYALAKGGANESVMLINRYLDNIDLIDYRLHKYYSKLISFSQYNPFVINDENFEKKYMFKKYYSVIKENGICYVYVYAPNFLSVLNQTFLAMYCSLLGLKGNLSHVSYCNVWNDRLGGLIWKKLTDPIRDTGVLKYFLKEIGKLQPEDYDKFFKECLSGTKLYNKIVKNKFYHYKQM